MFDPIRPFIKNQDALILDGGLATHLEALGCDLNDPLWSARLLIEDPDVIKQAHLDYLWAGADCIITASYQATVGGFQQRGLTETQAQIALRRAVDLALEARFQYWQDGGSRTGRLYPLVAASIGPYGAYLADGSEYSGQYGLTRDELTDWHRDRWHLLADSGADLLACETIPSFAEAEAFLTLLSETPKTAAWFAFSCRDDQTIWDGTPFEQCVAAVADHPGVVAVGVNCTAPRFVPDLIRKMVELTEKPLVAYPNSGETYDAASKTWSGQSDPAAFGSYSKEWRRLGAAVIGGCCRTTPAHIRQVRDRFRPKNR